MNRPKRAVPLLVLSAAFALFVQLSVALAGRVPAAALTSALTAGALIIVVLATPRPLAALRGLSRTAVLQSCAGGLMAVAGAPALIAALRLTDAPAGSIVVFWVSGGWAAIAACGAAVLALREGRMLGAGWSIAGALLALAGVAGVVADWERPSSFSPLVRFAPRELGMLMGGVLLLAGGLLLVRAARSASLDGALLWGAGSALSASLVWWAASGFARGWSLLGEQPLVVVLAAIAWGFVCTSWPATLKSWGPAAGAAALSVTPVLLSALILVEQAVGVAGPQPLIVPGVTAGSLLVLAGVCALARAAGAAQAVGPRWLRAVAAVPIVLAVAGLALPAVLARADVTLDSGVFTGSWLMSGAESVAGWAALALAVLVLVATFETRPAWPIVAAFAASAAWPWLRDVPATVWRPSLDPLIQNYYGTEYGSILFTSQTNVPMIGAVIAGAAVMLVIMAVRRVTPRGDASKSQHGGS
ncbi:MAG TPA: hypothetical protein VIK31_11020 [Propionibacteriaceae bacterium]